MVYLYFKIWNWWLWNFLKIELIGPYWRNLDLGVNLIQETLTTFSIFEWMKKIIKPPNWRDSKLRIMTAWDQLYRVMAWKFFSIKLWNKVFFFTAEKRFLSSFLNLWNLTVYQHLSTIKNKKFSSKMTPMKKFLTKIGLTYIDFF